MITGSICPHAEVPLSKTLSTKQPVIARQYEANPTGGRMRGKLLIALSAMVQKYYKMGFCFSFYKMHKMYVTHALRGPQEDWRPLVEAN